jgi:DNA adenine methylase
MRTKGELMQLGLALNQAETKLPDDAAEYVVAPSAPAGQLLKWIGNKQRFAQGIIAHFPRRYRTYFEPFMGSGAVLGTLSPERAVGGDAFLPLIDLWKEVRDRPEQVKQWYRDRHALIAAVGKSVAYKQVLDSYNRYANPADLLFLSRTCYGGVIRFRAADGFMSTPCGPHTAMPPDKFAARVDDWSKRIARTELYARSFEETIAGAGPGDIVYCDPPYVHSQTILYGAQRFSLEALFRSIEAAKKRGAFVALSIDGSKKSGNQLCDIPIPSGLFAREEMVSVGRSMLRRFQMVGESLENELVRDRLLLTH